VRTVFIVWNEAQTEGFVTDDRQAAHDASTGQQYSGVSSAAAAFAEMYEDDPQPLVVEEVQVTDVGEDG
jgi:hypothetical protein